MKPRNLVVWGAAMVAGLLGGRGVPVYADDAPARATDASPALVAARAVVSMRRATDASTVVEAYARARQAAPRSTFVVQEYVRRMAELDAPEMAASQAEKLLETDFTDALSIAVVAAATAKKGDAAGAITKIVSAVSFDPAEPFVLRTAARILAWRDTRPGGMAEDLETALQSMRTVVARQPGFAEAYRREAQALVAARKADASSQAAPATLLADDLVTDYEDDPLVLFASPLSCAYGTFGFIGFCGSWTAQRWPCGPRREFVSRRWAGDGDAWLAYCGSGRSYGRSYSCSTSRSFGYVSYRAYGTPAFTSSRVSCAPRTYRSWTAAARPHHRGGGARRGR